jgi:hypothetical protein
VERTKGVAVPPPPKKWNVADLQIRPKARLGRVHLEEVPVRHLLVRDEVLPGEHLRTHEGGPFCVFLQIF